MRLSMLAALLGIACAPRPTVGRDAPPLPQTAPRADAGRPDATPLADAGRPDANPLADAGRLDAARGGAAADLPRVALRPIASGAIPPLAADEARCDDDREDVATARLAVSSVEVTAGHSCLSTDNDGWLAMRSAGATFVTHTTLVAYAAGNMTAAPLHLSMLSDRLAVARLADGASELLYTIDLREDFSCVHAPCAEGHVGLLQYVMVCTMPGAGGGAPRCGDVKLPCPGTSCPAASLRDGVLTVAGQRVPITRD